MNIDSIQLKLIDTLKLVILVWYYTPRTVRRAELTLVTYIYNTSVHTYVINMLLQ